MNSCPSIFSEGPCINIDVLKAYKDNTLSREQIYNVERHLIDCPLCSAALDGLDHIDDFDRAKKEIEALEKKVIDKLYSKKKPSFWKYYAIAASIIGLVLTYWLFFPNKNSVEHIFDSHFTMYPNLTPITRNQSHESSFLIGMQQYEIQNYEQSMVLLKSILPHDNFYPAARFYLGLISLKNEKLLDAKKHFSYIITLNDPMYEHPAVWYLALTFVKSKQFEESKELFRELIEANSIYKARSETIIELINKAEVLH